MNQSANCRRFCSLLPRLGWGVLALIHVPIFGKVCVSLASENATVRVAGSAIGLTLTLGFFLLKLWNVSFLRLPKRKHSLLVFCLLVVFVHHDVRSAVVADSTWAQATVIAASTVFLSQLAIVRKRHSGELAQPAEGAHRRGRRYDRGSVDLPPLLRDCGRSVLAPRAPPA